MLILQMIQKITGFTQEQLANYLGVSRATVNYWLKGEEISPTSKRTISDKFGFPITYFDTSLNENIEVYKIIYSTLYKNWNSNNKNTNEDRIAQILNEIECDERTIYNRSVEEEDIIDGLCHGYDPFTGEIFSEEHILNNPEVKKVITKIKNKYYKYSSDIIEYNDLSNKQKNLFEKLRSWRMEKTIEEGFYSAYMIFNNRELINIICANVHDKEDLLGIRGIGPIKYEKYGEELFNIIKNNS